MSEYATLLPPRLKRARRCACGKSYDAAAWDALPNHRSWRIDEVWLDLCECACGSTMSVELEVSQ